MDIHMDIRSVKTSSVEPQGIQCRGGLMVVDWVPMNGLHVMGLTMGPHSGQHGWISRLKRAVESWAVLLTLGWRYSVAVNGPVDKFAVSDVYFAHVMFSSAMWWCVVCWEAVGRPVGDASGQHGLGDDARGSWETDINRWFEGTRRSVRQPDKIHPSYFYFRHFGQ